MVHIRRLLDSLGLTHRPILPRQRDGRIFRTDEDNLILDLSLEAITDCKAISSGLHAIPGVVEHGLFLGMCDLALIGAPDGSVIEMTKPEVTA